jgi:hypothetical protein
MIDELRIKSPPANVSDRNFRCSARAGGAAGLGNQFSRIAAARPRDQSDSFE